MHVVRGKTIDTLFSAEVIAARNNELAAQIKAGPIQDLLVISILKGSFIFAADLIRAMHSAGLAPEVEFITLSSYGKGTVSQGVKIIKDIDSDVTGRDILLIDDILESGRTLRFAKELMYERGARNVTIAVLLALVASLTAIPLVWTQIVWRRTWWLIWPGIAAKGATNAPTPRCATGCGSWAWRITTTRS